MRRRKPTVADKLLNEVAIYGGLPMRRADIYTLACEHMGKNADSRFGAWYFALHGPAIEAEAWPLVEARAVMLE